ncbi:MAG: response regulator [Acidobacteria bacterium]|jgi:DNA-binding NtrC family response regulator|nr:response regulator [Acidobacteriota bacterium]MBP8273268.1 response regulator [Acidobacteriota bacterium]
MALVLVIDDEADVRTVLKAWIARAGHDVLEAENADAALAVLEHTAVDIAFCDVQMPGRDGIWLTGEMRKRYPMMPVVLATAVGNVTPNVSMQKGVITYLLKPFEPEWITNALDMGLKWREETAHAGPKPEDVGDHLTDWLDSLKDL